MLKFRGLGVSFQAQTICPEVVERPFDRLTVLPSAMSSGRMEQRRRAPHFCIYGSSPTEQVFLSDGPGMCLSGDPFVPKMGAVRAEESCRFELDLPRTVFRFFLDNKTQGIE